MLELRASLTDPTGATSFSYDALGRVTSLTAPQTGTISYGYNARGERTQLTYPGSGAPSIGYSYTDDGQLATVTQSGATRAAYRYDPAGRLNQVGRLGSGLPGVTNYRYDRADRLIGVRTDARTTLLRGTTYTLDRAGRRVSVAETAPMSATPSATALRPLTFEAGLLIDSYTGADSRVGMSLDSNGAMKRGVCRQDDEQRQPVPPTDGHGRQSAARAGLRPAGWDADGRRAALQLRSGASAVGTLIVTTNRTVELRNGSTLIGTSVALTVGTIYRLGIQQTQGSGNGVLSAWLATGDAAFGSPFATSATQTVASAIDSVRLGSPGTGAVLRVTVDDLALDTASMPPASGVAATRTVAYGYDGVDRLTSAVPSGTPALSQSFSDDRAGNRVVSGVTYNAANQRSDGSYDVPCLSPRATARRRITPLLPHGAAAFAGSAAAGRTAHEGQPQPAQGRGDPEKPPRRPPTSARTTSTSWRTRW